MNSFQMCEYSSLLLLWVHSNRYPVRQTEKNCEYLHTITGAVSLNMMFDH